jgi:hypothetical protein
MDGAEPKSISASELYAAIGTAKVSLVFDVRRAGFSMPLPGPRHRRVAPGSAPESVGHRGLRLAAQGPAGMIAVAIIFRETTWPM